MLSLTLLLALVAVLWRNQRSRRLRQILLAVGVLLVLSSAYGLLPTWLLGRLQQGWPDSYTDWRSRNAIVLLGAGTIRAPDGAVQPGALAYPRILRALALYRACKAGQHACLLLISGGDPQHHGESEAHSYAREMIRLGVPGADLKLESRSLNTRQNAQYSRPILAAYAPDRVILVSSAFHLRRAQWNFRAEGMVTQPVRAGYLTVQPGWLPSTLNLTFTELALHEYLGLAQLAVYRLVGKL